MKKNEVQINRDESWKRYAKFNNLVRKDYIS